MAGGGRGRVVSAVATLARLAMAIGIGCMVFAAAMVLIVADRVAPASPELPTSLGLLGVMWAVAGFVVERLLRVIAGRPVEPDTAVPPSWHNQALGQNRRRHSRPARVPARQPQAAGWWTVLGVAADAPPATFEGAARHLLRQCHPDRWAMAEPARRQEAEGRTRIILQALAEARAASR